VYNRDAMSPGSDLQLSLIYLKHIKC